MNFVKKLIYFLFNKTKNKGWEKDTFDPRDYKFEDYFGNDIFGAVIPENFERNSELPRISDQDNTLACVCNSFSFVNAFNSKKEDNDVFLSWRFLYALVPRLSGGTTFRDNANILKSKGQCLDQQMPQAKYWLSSSQIKEKARITTEMYNNALTYRIKNYFYIRPYRKEEIKVACLKAPVIIGVYTSWKAWNKNIIVWDGIKQFGHAICVVGWTKNYWLITDWKGEGTIKKLDINYPIMSAMVLLDLPDKIKKLMLKTVKAENDSKIYLLLRNGEKQHIHSWEQYKEGLRKQLWRDYEIAKEEEIKSYPDTKHELTFEL